ncbi:uncharacterized protein LOC142609117 [Castanea sativa]|uniref:uncharacterized protein LOC142609117 n=1 Tax=Castanea sativa TaxID=21020 RepID=UPI003F64F676
MGNQWRFTDFYSEPETVKRSEAWSKLRQLNIDLNMPWLCVGDFNEITRQEEKLEGVERSHNQMQLFRDVIDECGFMDLGYVGPKFTWARRFENGRSIWERLDRGLANNEWFLKFPGAQVHHLQCNSSYHCPLLIVLAPLDIPQRKKPFRFEEMWLSNPSCGEVVRTEWDSTVGSNLSNEILRELLRKAEFEAQVRGENHRVRELKKEIDVLMDREATMWAQRSRLLWAGQGDKNTKYFHSRATKRFRKNQIRGIRDEMDDCKTEPGEIAAVLTGYY